jgi:hypothetical protein
MIAFLIGKRKTDASAPLQGRILPAPAFYHLIFRIHQLRHYLNPHLL